MYQEIDCRGLACPQPVINTKKALEKLSEGTVMAIVDNEAAKENLLKFANGMNLSADFELVGGDYKVSIHKEGAVGRHTQMGAVMSNAVQNADSTYSILVTSNVLGKGSEELGAVLIKSFFYSLTEHDQLPMSIAFLNSGVYLTCEDSPVLEHIMNLEGRKCEILSCGTCLDFYQLKEKLCVGSVSNMYTILETLQKAGKVITI